MRITLLNQFFHPDTAATSQLLTDLARELASLGHDVTAICAKGNYGSEDSTAPPNVTILRSNPLPFSHTHPGRIASYATFLAASAALSLQGPAPDVIVTLTTPPLLSLIGRLVSRVRGSRHFIWEMDLYPDIAVDLEVFRAKSLLTKFIGFLADHPRHHAHGIIALGDDMRERLIARGIPPDKIHVVHNWADRSEIHSHPFAPFPLTVHYSGNLGLAHDIATIQQAMLALANEPRIRFIFAGGGPQRNGLQSYCESHNLAQVEFRPYCDRSQLSRSLAEGHLGLVTQKPETIGSIVPSKIYGIMAAGRPLLYVGPHRATPARIIERFECGWHVEAGDSENLISLLNRLAHRPDEIRAAGERARRAFLEYFERRLGVAKIVAILGAEQQRAAATA
jgi:glycosyltransferase involved in cell wall biosynthesis